MNKYHYEIASLERCDAMSMFFAALTLVSGVFICGVSIDEEVQGFKLNLCFGRLSVVFLAVSFGGESEGAPESLSFQKYGLILVWSGTGPQILSFPAPQNPSKSTHEFTENTELIHQCRGDLVVRPALQPASGYEPPGRPVSDADAIG